MDQCLENEITPENTEVERFCGARFASVNLSLLAQDHGYAALAM